MLLRWCLISLLLIAVSTADSCAPDQVPVSDICASHPVIDGLPCQPFVLNFDSPNSDQAKHALELFQKYADEQNSHFLGYQVNQNFDYQQLLSTYLKMHLNNVGDPFVEGHFTLNTKIFERAVLDYYARLWNAKLPHNQSDPESYWGYILSMGSSEGNIYALWSARDYLSGKVLLNEPATSSSSSSSSTQQPQSPTLAHRYVGQSYGPRHAFTPVAFYSEDTHYSIIKAMRVLGIQTFYDLGMEEYPYDCPLGGDWPTEVPSTGGPLGPGTIDLDALEKLVTFFASKGYPILVSLNYGTTFKGAYDDVAGAAERLMPVFTRYGLAERRVWYSQGASDTRTGYWFHVDGALGGSYMPFLQRAHEKGLLAQAGPRFDFSIPAVKSIVMSGHKWIGSPWPCGVFMTKVGMQMRPPDDPMYIGSPDTTFAGSRNALSPMIFWSFLATHSADQQMQLALDNENLAQYAYEQLKALEVRLGKDLWIQRSPLSLTVLFKQASEHLIRKYSLSGEVFTVNGTVRKYSHIYLLSGANKQRIDGLIEDLASENGIPEQSEHQQAPSRVGSELPRGELHIPTGGRGFH